MFCLPNTVYAFSLTVHFSYGYATNTRVKFIIVIENTSSQSRDGDMKVVSQQIKIQWNLNIKAPIYTVHVPDKFSDLKI